MRPCTANLYRQCCLIEPGRASATTLIRHWVLFETERMRADQAGEQSISILIEIPRIQTCNLCGRRVSHFLKEIPHGRGCQYGEMVRQRDLRQAPRGEPDQGHRQ